MEINKIISIGLIAIGAISVIGWLILSWKAGQSIGTELPISVTAGLVGVLTGKGLAKPSNQSNESNESNVSEKLKNVQDTAGEARKIVASVEAIKDIVKKA